MNVETVGRNELRFGPFTSLGLCTDMHFLGSFSLPSLAQLCASWAFDLLVNQQRQSPRFLPGLPRWY